MSKPLVPLLAVRNAPDAIAFYIRAFSAVLVARYDHAATGTVSHADLAIDGWRFSLTEEARAWGADAPPSLGGTPVVLQLAVTDAHAAVACAALAGAEVVFPVQEFCGERMGRLRDPFGHVWILSQELVDLAPSERQRRRNALAPSTSRNEAPLSTASATELARRIRTREISSVEATEYFIARIEKLDASMNAVVVRDFSRARDAARRADEAIARGQIFGRLHGVPMTIKESFDVAGLATTWGVPVHAANIADTDSVVVARYRAAGAHFLGKTNVPTMLGDFQSDNALFGRTRNPWDETRTPGGSSGGAAAAVAAGLTALETGSDIGGSIRNPAHYCGIYGHKPTSGIISLDGHGVPGVPRNPDMAVAGPLARSAEDLELALDMLAAPGTRLPLSPRRPGLRVAIWADDPVAPVDSEVANAAVRLGELLSKHGAVVSESARPSFDPNGYRQTYAALVSAVMGAAAGDEAYAEYAVRAGGLDPEDRSRVAESTRSLVLSHRAWLKHDEERQRLRAVWSAFFEEWDVLVCPIMATPAFPLDDRPPFARTITVNGAPQPYFDQVFWASLATLAYLPATAFPASQSSTGLPIGLQAIGASHRDRTAIGLARWGSELTGGFVPPPLASR